MSQGVYVDFVLRSNIAQRGRTFREVLASGEPLVIDGDIVSRDRRKIPMRFTLSPLRNREEEPVGLVIVLDDLSAMVASSRHSGPMSTSPNRSSARARRCARSLTSSP